LNKKHELRKNTLSLSRLCALLGESGKTNRPNTLGAILKKHEEKRMGTLIWEANQVPFIMQEPEKK